MDKIRNINDIIKSELVARTNNTNIRQEYGRLGVHSNVSVSGGYLALTTQYKIDTAIHFTVNGVTQSLGADYEIVMPNKLQLLSSGSFPTDTILNVSYQYDKTVSSLFSKPEINMFGISPEPQPDGSVFITFNFVITPNSGTDIFWVIIKNGRADDIVASGEVLNSMGNDPYTADISVHEAQVDNDTKVIYTMVLTYNMPNGVVDVMDQKVMEDTEYEIPAVESILGDVNINHQVAVEEGRFEYNTSYTLIIPVNSIPVFAWKFTKKVAEGAEVIMASGDNVGTIITKTYAQSQDLFEADNYNIVYTLYMDEGKTGTYTVLDSESLKIRVPEKVEEAFGGWIPVSHYEDGDGVTILDTFDKLNDAINDNTNSYVDVLKSLSKADVLSDEAIYFDPIAEADLTGKYMYFINMPTSFTGNSQGIIEISSAQYVVAPTGYARHVGSNDRVIHVIDAYPTVEAACSETGYSYKHKNIS